MALTTAEFEAIITRLQEANIQMIQTLFEGKDKERKDQKRSMIDTRGVGKPPNFKRIPEKYPEWMSKFSRI